MARVQQDPFTALRGCGQNECAQDPKVAQQTQPGPVWVPHAHPLVRGGRGISTDDTLGWPTAGGGNSSTFTGVT